MTVEMHEKLAQAVIDGDPVRAKALALEAVEKGLDARACITELTKGVQHIGKLHSEGGCSLLDLLNSASAVKVALTILEPVLNKSENREI
ncbi:MAG: B12-binding domain-containing protein [Anaerolineae bacterium]|uniref:B12-binding domain-containing protein n=1 Tax=Candidatus Desulfolinea nitratireducens TaxID=2841698 RepID=A0A8J6THE1_9CHLR|nr:B12-binding domain-containing protein [Candidatus Desulfolinea nitratireducens]MBL6960379.1 B12-binding domain-containing protein [Anaerolineales bacterium]NQU29694.1 B12-binding domain-containing protein [Anaerolineae bacterium]